MKICIKVKPNAKEAGVEKISDSFFSVRVKEPAKNGKANEAVCLVLADYFGVPVYSVRIVSGHCFRQKIVEIFDNR